MVLVAYATRYGSTKQAAEGIAAALRKAGMDADLKPLRTVRTLEGYRGVVLGAPLFMFRWHNDALSFLSRYRKALETQPVAIFALGPTHVPYDEKEWRDSRAQVDKELEKFPWLHQVALEIFGGRYDPAKLGLPIRWLAGDTPATDLLDEKAIRAWAVKIKPCLVA
jgi:menaquinone-dependent protoporphyrinogen oxidase